MIFGYARVSSDDQNLDRQLDAFEKLDIEPINIFKEKITGQSMERRELDQLLSRLRSGDTLYMLYLQITKPIRRNGNRTSEQHKFTLESLLLSFAIFTLFVARCQGQRWTDVP